MNPIHRLKLGILILTPTSQTTMAMHAMKECIIPESFMLPLKFPVVSIEVFRLNRTPDTKIQGLNWKSFEVRGYARRKDLQERRGPRHDPLKVASSNCVQFRTITTSPKLNPLSTPALFIPISGRNAYV